MIIQFISRIIRYWCLHCDEGRLFTSAMIKRLTWLCLSLQIFTAASPVIASVAKLDSPASTWSADLQSRPAQVYTLGPGETTAVIAERLGLTFSQLQAYNQFRSFSKPFNQLAVGDELDIPSSGMTISAQPAKQAPVRENTSNDTATLFAGRVSTLANMAESDDMADAAAGIARTTVSGAANSSVEQWLGQFGTVQAQLNLDDNWRLDESSIDWLVPFYETSDNLLFTQLGWRNNDERSTLNLGLGMRWFTADSMYGFNSFYDADISGDNHRLGTGVEYWRDYMTLSANGYFGLTDWHQSRDFADYDERPADGFDVRLNGWLPSYPQFGGKLIYEQYYGEDVALFGNDADQRQKNPRAVTTGVNWTPFPLLTMGLDHRVGEDGLNDTSVNLQVNWKPDVSWASQITSTEVDNLRRLSGSRHNLVDRNNDIVLEYRKQVVIKAKVGPSSVRDIPGSSHTVIVQVSGKYPLRTVAWDNAAFVAAGGTFSQADMTRAQLTLPPYQPEAPTSNFYVLTATAEDTNGNRATPEQLTVEVLPPLLSFSGDMGVSGDGAPADGKTPVTVTTTVTDSNGKPFVGQTVNMKVVYTDSSEQTRAVVTNEKGLATLDITSTIAGKANVTATAGTISQQGVITFTDISVVAERSSLTVSPDTIVADGMSFSTLSLEANNQSGQPQAGLKDVTFRVSGVAGTSVTQAEESSPGVYVAKLSGTRTGQAQVTPVAAGNTLAELTKSVTLTGNDATAGIVAGDLSVVTNGAKADGVAHNSVKAVVKDAHGNTLASQLVSFTADNGAVIAPSGTSGVDGSVIVSLTSTMAGSSTVTASVNGSNQMVAVNFVADSGGSIASGDLTVVSDGAKADGVAQNSVKAVVKDAHGNPLANQLVSFVADNGAVIGSSGTTGSDGSVTMSLKSIVSGNSKVSATTNGSTQEVSVNFVSGDANIATSTIAATPMSVVADGISESAITLTLKDINDNAAIGQSVVFDSSLAGSFVGSVTDNRDGTYTAALTGRKMGTTSITAQVNGSAFGVAPVVVTLLAGNPDVAHSALAAGSASIVADGSDSSRLTITLKDVYDNIVTGQTVSFVSSLSGTTVGSVTDNGDGTYTADLTGTSEGITSISAMVNGSAFGVPAISVELTAILTLSTNGKTYSSTVGFPSTGFRNADFQILLNGSVPANYSWSSNRSWVNVTSTGKVSLTGTPSAGSKTVTVTGTPGTGGTPQVYTFTVKNWYTTPGSTKMTGTDGGAYCSSQGTVQISFDDADAVTGEWGGLNAYPTSDFGVVADTLFATFTSTPNPGQTNHYWIKDLFGSNLDQSTGPDFNKYYVTCRTSI